jgi:hypothetical protein
MKHNEFHRLLSSVLRLYKLWRKLGRPVVPGKLLSDAKKQAARSNVCREYEARLMPWYLLAEYESQN